MLFYTALFGFYFKREERREMRTINTSIQGTSPLLQHRMAVEQEGKVKLRTGNPDWEQEVYKALYQSSEGVIYQPANHFEASFKNAAKNYKIAGKRGASYSKLVASTVEVKPDIIRPVLINNFCKFG